MKQERQGALELIDGLLDRLLRGAGAHQSPIAISSVIQSSTTNLLAGERPPARRHSKVRTVND
jgi:hypothetical protein